MDGRLGEHSNCGELYLVEYPGHESQNVIKIIKYGRRDQPAEEEVYNEVDMQLAAIKLGVAPNILQVIQGNITKKQKFVGIIIQGLSYTLASYCNLMMEDLMDRSKQQHHEMYATNLYNALKECRGLLYRLHNGGIVHEDAHMHNFMRDDVAGRWYLIDYGLASWNSCRFLIKVDYVQLDQAEERLFELYPSLNKPRLGLPRY